jgi:hypothetical protein
MHNTVHTNTPATLVDALPTIKKWVIKLPLLNGHAIQAGVVKQRLTTTGKHRLFFINLIGPAPVNIGDTSVKKMYGLQIVQQQGNVKMGIIQRRQTIQKIQ